MFSVLSDIASFISSTNFTAPPEPFQLPHVEHVSSGEEASFSFLTGDVPSSLSKEASVLSCKIRTFVAPTVIATAIVSFNSSAVAPSSLATARQYFVQPSHPAPREAPKAIKCFVLRSKAPSA